MNRIENEIYLFYISLIAFFLLTVAVLAGYRIVDNKTESDSVLLRDKNSMEQVLFERDDKEAFVDGADVYKEVLEQKEYDISINGKKYTVEDIKNLRETDPFTLQKTISLNGVYSKKIKIEGDRQVVEYILT